ncbi:DUF397 domain-containing protein [Kitasatospora sp. NPDC087861]
MKALRLSSGVAIRDSKDESGPNLQFTTEAWQGLVASIKAGELS